MPAFFFTTKDKFTCLAPVIRFAMTHKLPATEQYTEGTELARELAKPCWWHVQLAASVLMQKKSTKSGQTIIIIALLLLPYIALL